MNLWHCCLLTMMIVAFTWWLIVILLFTRVAWRGWDYFWRIIRHNHPFTSRVVFRGVTHFNSLFVVSSTLLGVFDWTEECITTFKIVILMVWLTDWKDASILCLIHWVSEITNTSYHGNISHILTLFAIKSNICDFFSQYLQLQYSIKLNVSKIVFIT